MANPDNRPSMLATRTIVSLSLIDRLTREGVQRHLSPCSIRSRDIDAMVPWMPEGPPLRAGSKYSIKHTTRWGKAMVKELQYRLDVNNLHRDGDATQLGLNEIGRVRLRTTTPFFFDEYRRNRETGSFILVEDGTTGSYPRGYSQRSFERLSRWWERCF